jgi:hypothetical protein
MIPSQFLPMMADPDADKLVITTAVSVDDQSGPSLQIRYNSGKLYVGQNDNRILIRNCDLSNFSKFALLTYTVWRSIDRDASNIYAYSGSSGRLYSFSPNTYLSSAFSAYTSGRMIDASGDPLHVYATSNNAADGHGIRMVTKSTMAVTGGGTPVQILATGTGDNQFTNPLGILYIATNADSGNLFICEATRIVKLAVVTTTGSESLTWTTSYAIAANDLAWDGTNFYVQSSTQTIRYDASFTDATKVAVACVGYSITYIPDQSDGYGPTLAIADSTNSHLERRKCSDLSAINSVGSAGDGSSSLCDPKITGASGIWQDDEGSAFSAASGADIYKHGFAGDFFRSPGPHRMKWTGLLSGITAIDANTDGIIGEIKNLHKCINLTSLKLQTNPALVLNLGQLSAKMVTLWAYACGAGIAGSIRHMILATSINLRENGASSAQVDQWIGDLYANKDIMAPGTANFNGTNLAPSAGAKAQADELIATYGWTVAYTA